MAIDGRDEMRRYYEKLFANASVLDVTVVTSLVQEWLVFHDLQWRVRLERGPRRGSEVRFRTAEYMPFDGDRLGRYSVDVTN